MSEWQPIETAPRDGSVIITTCGNYPNDILTSRWSVIMKRWDYGETPTHWMPLPDAPVLKLLYVPKDPP